MRWLKSFETRVKHRAEKTMADLYFRGVFVFILWNPPLIGFDVLSTGANYFESRHF